MLFIVVTADDYGSLERGVFFQEETKILLAEKFVNAQFLVPYPKFDIQLTESLDKLAKNDRRCGRCQPIGVTLISPAEVKTNSKYTGF